MIRLVSEMAFIIAMSALLAVTAWNAVSRFTTDKPAAAIEGPGQTVNKSAKSDRQP